jgi:hypothetical protein
LAEQGTKTVKLQEVDPEIFEAFRQWLHKLPSHAKGVGVQKGGGWLDLYRMADCHLISGLQLYVIKQFKETFTPT